MDARQARMDALEAQLQVQLRAQTEALAALKEEVAAESAALNKVIIQLADFLGVTLPPPPRPEHAGQLTAEERLEAERKKREENRHVELLLRLLCDSRGSVDP